MIYLVEMEISIRKKDLNIGEYPHPRKELQSQSLLE
jgi:hypothetical protein